MDFLRKNIANFITLSRIIGAVIIFFLKPLSLEFFIVYGIIGASDAIDGFIARRFHLESKIGSILDSVCDLIFLSAMAYSIFPTLINSLHIWSWVIIIIPTALQLVAYLICAIKFKRFSSIHTFGNKLLSLSIFFFPFTFIGNVRWIYETYLIVFSIFAIYSSLEINLIHLFAKKYDEKNKNLYLLFKKNNSDN